MNLPRAHAYMREWMEKNGLASVVCELRDGEFRAKDGAELSAENERLTRWRKLIDAAPTVDAQGAAIARFQKVEELQPFIQHWKDEVGRLKAENAKLKAHLEGAKALVDENIRLTRIIDEISKWQIEGFGELRPHVERVEQSYPMQGEV
jgi:uncharacterized small protein (DUF1192 family)